MWPGVWIASIVEAADGRASRRARSCRRCRSRLARRVGEHRDAVERSSTSPSSATWSWWWWVSSTWVERRGRARSTASSSGCDRPARVDQDRRRRPARRRRDRCWRATGRPWSARRIMAPMLAHGGTCAHGARSTPATASATSTARSPSTRRSASRSVGRMPIRDEAINVFMGLPGDGDAARADLQPRRRLLRARHGLQPHRGRRSTTSTGRSAGLAEQGIEPEKPPYRVREGGSRLCFVRDPDGYRDRAHRARRLSGSGASAARPSSTSARTRSASSSSPRSTARGGSAPTRSTSRVRIGAGLDADRRAAREARWSARCATLGALRRTSAARAPGARATSSAVATSAIRDAANRDEFLRARASAAGCAIRVLVARGGGALRLPRRGATRPRWPTGVVLDLGGGSLQLVRVDDRRAARARLLAAGRGAHDRALPAAASRRPRRQLAALRDARARRRSPSAPWLAARASASSGIGGTVRNLAAAAAAPRRAAVASASRASAARRATRSTS